MGPSWACCLGKDPGYRPIKLKCATLQQKDDIFRAVAQIKLVHKFASISLTNDLFKEDLLVHKKVYMLHTEAATKPNVTSRMRGNKIEINGKLYQRDQFDNLPFGVSRESASTVTTEKGIVFKSLQYSHPTVTLPPYLYRTNFMTTHALSIT